MSKSVFIYLLFFIQIPLFQIANGLPTKWTSKNPFEQKVFIENKGQYNLKNTFPSSFPVLFSSQQDGMDYYFTKNAIYIKHIKYVKRTEREKEAEMKRLGIKEEKENEEEKEFSYKAVEEFNQIEFVGASCSEIIPEEVVHQMYNFCLDNKSTLQAHAYKKLTYKNLYPGIDMEFVFPEDKQGFKYSFIVHAGADVSNIKMKYPLAKKTTIDKEGNLLIKSLFGIFTDHVPVVNEIASSKSVACSFLLQKNNEVSFSVGNYDRTKDILIDPWTTTPIFTGNNKAFDVDWDAAGNCYAYGGSPPFKLIKFNNAGVQQWVYTTIFTGVLNNNTVYGDFAVDRHSQSVYIVEGDDPATGANVQKLSQSGMPVITFPGNPNFYEMWRIAFSRCTNQAVIAGGGWASIPYTAAFLDTSLTTLTPINVLNTSNLQHDMWGLALDDFGNCYMSTAQSYPNPSFFNNILYKLPLPALAPSTWSVSTGHLFNEVASVSYYTNTFSGFPYYSNGFNGMATSNSSVYTYDSYVLKKWNMASGVLVSSVNVNGASQSTMSYGGISSDGCDHIFLGLNSSVVQYNAAMTVVNTITTTGAVYDVNLANNNILYVCGDGFVSAIQPNMTPCNGNITVTNNISSVTCGTASGSATVTPTGGTAPYTISWNTNPVQTGTVAANLPAGTYVATITDNSCITQIKLDTVIISPGPASFSLALVGNPVNCTKPNSGSASVNITGGTGPYTTSWSNGQVGLNDTALFVGTYTVSVIDQSTNCQVTSTVTIGTSPAFTLSTSANPTTCLKPNGGSASVTIAGGVGPFITSWSNGQAGLNDTALIVGTYTVQVTDVSDNCTNSAIVSIVQAPTLSVSVSSGGIICMGQSYTLNAVSLGGIAPYTYNWNNGAGNTNPFIVSPASSSTYTVVVTDVNGCKAKDSLIMISIYPPLHITLGDTGICAGNRVTITASTTGGNGVYAYSWMPGNLHGNGVSVSPANTTIYTVTVNDGCTTPAAFDTGQVNIVSAPVITMPNAVAGCAPLCVTFTNTLTGIVNWQWNFGDGTTSSSKNLIHCYTTSGSFYPSITYTATTGCMGKETSTNTITVYAVSHAQFLASPNPTDILNPEVYFTNQFVNTNNWLWTFGDGTSSNNQNPSHVYGQPGTYIVTLIAQNKQGCNDTVTEQIIVNDIFTFYAPNTFSPNGDGINDFFKPLGTGWDNAGYNLWIFDRWGNLFFHTSDTNKGWDGTLNGKTVQEDVYVWKANLNDYKRESHSYNGTITVIK